MNITIFYERKRFFEWKLLIKINKKIIKMELKDNK